MLLKCCIQYVSKFGKLNSGHRTGKGQFSFQSQRMAVPKNVPTQLSTVALISHASKVILKILQARLQQCMNQELLHVQAGFRKHSSVHWTGKGQFSFQSQRRAVPKNAQIIGQLYSFPMLVRLC